MDLSQVLMLAQRMNLSPLHLLTGSACFTCQLFIRAYSCDLKILNNTASVDMNAVVSRPRSRNVSNIELHQCAQLHIFPPRMYLDRWRFGAK